MKILSAKQIKELDAYTISSEPIASIDLMERACKAFINWFVIRFDITKTIGIVCGTGNNGGDGLAIARLLHERGYSAKVWIIKGSVPETEDFKQNFKRLQDKVEIVEISDDNALPNFDEAQILIDAIFGSGLSRPAEGVYAKGIEG